MSLSEQLGDLVLTLFLAVVMGVAYLLVVLLWRTIRKRPLLPIAERTKIDSPRILYVGIGLFGVPGLAVFLKDLAVLSVLSLLMMSGCVGHWLLFEEGGEGESPLV
jgi:hypothetical protein